MPPAPPPPATPDKPITMITATRLVTDLLTKDIDVLNALCDRDITRVEALGTVQGRHWTRALVLQALIFAEQPGTFSVWDIMAAYRKGNVSLTDAVLPLVSHCVESLRQPPTSTPTHDSG